MILLSMCHTGLNTVYNNSSYVNVDMSLCMSAQGPSWGPDSGTVQLLWPGGPFTLILNLHMVPRQTQLGKVSVVLICISIVIMLTVTAVT